MAAFFVWIVVQFIVKSPVLFRLNHATSVSAFGVLLHPYPSEGG